MTVLWENETRTNGSVEKVSIPVIASDRRERGNLKLQVVQRIEIATATRNAWPRNDVDQGLSTSPNVRATHPNECHL